MSDNIEELKDAVAQSLESNGILSKIRAELRKHVFLAIDGNQPLYNVQNKRLQDLHTHSQGSTMLGIIMEFLDFYNLNASLSVLRQEIGKTTRVDDHKELVERMNIRNNDVNKCILQCLMEKQTNDSKSNNEKDEMLLPSDKTEPRIVAPSSPPKNPTSTMNDMKNATVVKSSINMNNSNRNVSNVMSSTSTSPPKTSNIITSPVAMKNDGKHLQLSPTRDIISPLSPKKRDTLISNNNNSLNINNTTSNSKLPSITTSPKNNGTATLGKLPPLAKSPTKTTPTTTINNTNNNNSPILSTNRPSPFGNIPTPSHLLVNEESNDKVLSSINNKSNLNTRSIIDTNKNKQTEEADSLEEAIYVDDFSDDNDDIEIYAPVTTTNVKTDNKIPLNVTSITQNTMLRDTYSDDPSVTESFDEEYDYQEPVELVK